MLGMPAATPYDVNFRFLGIPARISPWFWIGALLLSPEKEPRELLLFTVCALFSILVHEYGHGLMARAFGFQAQIALFALGGLCASESERQTPRQRLAVLASGPGAQLVLLALVMAGLGTALLGLGWADHGRNALYFLGLEDRLIAREPNVALSSTTLQSLYLAYFYLVYINWLWPLLNLLPIWPLDGGQMMHVFWTRMQGRDGARRSHVVSMVTAGLLAGWILSNMRGGAENHSIFALLFFGWFVLINYQMLQVHQYGGGWHGDDDEADWWKR